MAQMAKSERNPKQIGWAASKYCPSIGRVAAWVLLGVFPALPVHVASAASDVPLQPGSAKQIVSTVMANEELAGLHRDHYAYVSKERSDRTGGHLWTEKVVETNTGKVRMLLEEDGQPLSADRIAQERGRLAGIVANPAAFARKAQATKDDEAHARQMLLLAPRAFLFDEPREEGTFLRIDFKPNPDYETQSMEERVLHAMSGTMLVDPQTMRLHHIEGRLPTDVSIGFGLLATIHAGSSFATTRDRLGQPDWKTTLLDTAINGKAIFFKSIAKNEHAEHSDFVRVSNDLSVAQAVTIAEQ
jgi:hypothetical protein